MTAVTEKIKNLCAAKKISAEELAEGSGLTVPQVKRILEEERIPSLASIIKIARALGVRPGTFLDDTEAMGPVVTRHTENFPTVTFTSHLTDDHSHMDFASLAAKKAGRNMEPFLIEIRPIKGEKSFSSHEGEEFLYVLEGTLVVYYGKETYELHKGDSIYYDSIVDHLVTAGDNSKATILGVVYAPA